jgi:hypothetical protein
VKASLVQARTERLRDDHHVNDADSLVDGSKTLHDGWSRQRDVERGSLDSRLDLPGDWAGVEHINIIVVRLTSLFSSISTTSRRKLLTGECDDSRSRGVSVSERYPRRSPRRPSPHRRVRTGAHSERYIGRVHPSPERILRVPSPTDRPVTTTGTLVDEAPDDSRADAPRRPGGECGAVRSANRPHGRGPATCGHP